MSINLRTRPVAAMIAAAVLMGSFLVQPAMADDSPGTISFELPRQPVGELTYAGDKAWVFEDQMVDAEGVVSRSYGNEWEIVDNHYVRYAGGGDKSTYRITNIDTGEVVTREINRPAGVSGWSYVTPLGWLAESESGQLEWRSWNGNLVGLGELSVDIFDSFGDWVVLGMGQSQAVRVSTKTGKRTPFVMSPCDGCSHKFSLTEQGISWSSPPDSDGRGHWGTLGWDSEAPVRRTYTGLGSDWEVAAVNANQLVVKERGEGKQAYRVLSATGEVAELDFTGGVAVSPSGTLFGEAEVDGRRYVARVEADGVMSPVVEGPTRDTLAFQLALAGDQVLGLDDRRDGYRPETGWRRTITQGVVNGETLLPGRASWVVASAGRSAANDINNGELTIYDRGVVKAVLPGAWPSSMSGPYLKTVSSKRSESGELVSVVKTVDSRGSEYQAEGPVFGRTVVAEGGVWDFSTGERLWDSKGTLPKGAYLKDFWGPWVAYSDSLGSRDCFVLNRQTARVVRLGGLAGCRQSRA